MKNRIFFSLFSVLACTSKINGFSFFTYRCKKQVVPFSTLIKTHRKPFKILKAHAQYHQSAFSPQFFLSVLSLLGKPTSVVCRCDIELDFRFLVFSVKRWMKWDGETNLSFVSQGFQQLWHCSKYLQVT